MHTRSNIYPSNSTATIPRRSNRRRVSNIVELEIRTIEEIVPMADRTMEELLQAPTKGYGEAIIILKILAENFEIKTNLLQLVQANKFHGFERDNPHTHINNFKRMTATLKYRDVSNDAINLMLFPYSLEGAARIWDNVSKTDDKIDKLADQISNLVEIVNKQVIALAKAVEKTCVTCGGAHAYYDFIATDSNQTSVCAATGSYNQVSPPNRTSHQILPTGFALVPLSVPNEFSNYMKSNEIMIKSMQNQINVLKGDFNKQKENLRRNLNNYMRSILGSFFQDQPSTLGTLSSNTVPNPKGEMKVVTTRSGLAYEGPSIPTNSPLEKVDEQNTKQILDKEHSNSLGSTTQVQPPVVPILVPEPDVLRTQPKTTIPYPSSFVDALLLMPKFASTIKSLLANKDKIFELAKVSLNENCLAMLLKKLPEKLGDSSGEVPFLTDFVVVDFEADPRVPLILGRSFMRTSRALIDVYGEEITLRVNDEFVTFNLNQTMRYSSTYDDTSVNRVYVIDIACEEFVQNVLDFQYNPKSSSPTLVFDASVSGSDSRKEPIVKCSSPTLTPFGESDFFLKEIKDFLNDDSIPTGIENFVYDSKGDILFLEKLLNEDSFQLPPMDLKLVEESKAKSSVEEPLELELKELPSHLEYAFLEDSNKLPKISDIKGIDPRFCTHKILIEDDYKPAVQSQRRVNPKIHDVIKKEVIKLLDTDMIYPIFDSPKLNDATRKDHFPLPFMDHMLERLAENEFYCFLDGTFQRCMMSIFHDMIEKTMEVFMDDFSVFGDSFSSCLTCLDKMLERCKETNLVLNWEKCHFMYREGIKLGFFRIFRPMTHLLEKEIPFVFFKECIDAFDTLKKKLTEAPILVVLDWNLPFELMCDASDYAIGAVLGQRKTKHFQPIHYARSENLAADHLSRLENPHKDELENKDINDNFPLETLGSLTSHSSSWFADIANFHAVNFIKKGLTSQQKKFFKDVKHYFWDDPYLF
nr:DNA-directed DNA polymerase [Tanacetum cinerariifolium]